jgi:predicted DNA-binding transcriptional regulator AlpA
MRLRDVGMTSFKSQVHHLMRPERTADFTQGTFPNWVSLAGRAVGWLEAEIQEWLQRRIEASRNVKM